MPSKIPSSPHLCNWASWEERRRSANWTIVGGVVGPVWARQRDRTCCAGPTWYLSKSLPNSAIVQVLLFKLTYISKKHFNQIIIGRGSGLSSSARSHMLCRSDFEAANEPELVASCRSRRVNSESRARGVYRKWAWIYFLRFCEGRQLWSCLWTGLDFPVCCELSFNAVFSDLEPWFVGMFEMIKIFWEYWESSLRFVHFCFRYDNGLSQKHKAH